MQEETSIWLQTSLSNRVQNILADYPTRDSLKADFAEPIKSLKDKLGQSVVESYLDMLESGCWQELVKRLMENYYDPLYQHTLPKSRIEVDLKGDNNAMDSLECAIATVLNNSNGEKSFAPQAGAF
jgi:tRNA 2-selenouridine synthase